MGSKKAVDIRQAIEQAKVPSLNGGGYVYVLRSKYEPLFKIGVSIDVSRRIKQLKWSLISGVDTAPVHVIKSKGAQHLERALHILFCQKRERHIGEWFTLHDDDIQWIRTLECVNGYALTRIR